MDSQGRVALLEGWDWPASTATLRETVLYNERVAYAKQDCQQLKGPGLEKVIFPEKAFSQDQPDSLDPVFRRSCMGVGLGTPVDSEGLVSVTPLLSPKGPGVPSSSSGNLSVTLPCTAPSSPACLRGAGPTWGPLPTCPEAELSRKRRQQAPFFRRTEGPAPRTSASSP